MFLAFQKLFSGTSVEKQKIDNLLDLICLMRASWLQQQLLRALLNSKILFSKFLREP